MTERHKKLAESLRERIEFMKEIRNEIAESDKEITLAIFALSGVEEDDTDDMHCFSAVVGPEYVVAGMVADYMTSTTSYTQDVVAEAIVLSMISEMGD